MKYTFKSVLMGMLAVLALSAVTATAAQAAIEGPFYKIAGSRLTEGQSKEIKGKIKERYIFSFPRSMELSCTKQVLVAGAKLLGSTGANAGTGEVTMEFSGCATTNNGEEGCKVEEPVKTKPLKVEQVYTGPERSEDIGAYFTPVTKKGEREEFMEIKWPSSKCDFHEVRVEGSVAADDFSVATGVPVAVGKEPAEASTMALRFPERSLTTVWSEKSGALVQAKPALRWTGFGQVLIVGSSTLELASGANWGLFT